MLYKKSELSDGSEAIYRADTILIEYGRYY